MPIGYLTHIEAILRCSFLLQKNVCCPSQQHDSVHDQIMIPCSDARIFLSQIACDRVCFETQKNEHLNAPYIDQLDVSRFCITYPEVMGILHE